MSLAHIYTETFDEGPGGWNGWHDNVVGPRRLEWKPGALTSRSPWWIDYNHAPPGAGYLHILLASNTRGALGEREFEAGGRSSLIDGDHPIDYRGASITLGLRGELDKQGAEVVFLAQANHDGITSGWICTGRPFDVTDDWSEQTVTLDTDSSLWTCTGSRHNRTETYGELPLERVLSAVNVNILFILFPLTVEPMGPLDGDRHIMRPEKDYPVWRSRLPEGYVSLKRVEIDFL